MREIKNLKKAAERIKKAIREKESIILYGDADMDGASSVVILKESIAVLGGSVKAFYFPNREKEGYGITRQALEILKKESPALLVAVDCGIGNFEEIKEANKLGFKVVVIDHHEILDGLPEAEIVVDPKQEGDDSSFEYLAATGIVFKLSEVLLGDKMTREIKRNFLELTALATLADMMPKKGDNSFYIQEGLDSLNGTFRPGLKAFLNSEELKECSDLNQKVYKIISLLNVRELENNYPFSFRILVSSSVKEAEEIISKLFSENKIRKERIANIIKMIKEDESKRSGKIVFFGEEDFNIPIMGSAASIICKNYLKPTFIFKKMEKESQGTVRTPSGIDSVSLMKNCSNLLITFGGHPQASGFRIKNENLEKFKKCLIENLPG